MKIALVCEHGGHLTEMQMLVEAFEEHDFFFITNRSSRTELLSDKKYLIEPIGMNFFNFLRSLVIFIKIFYKEKPRVIISTGAEIAIPAFIVGKLFFKTKNIFIESWCRVLSTSKTGRILYPISDIFLVQWPELAVKYGKKAQYFGGIF
jgi:UDP-N-acetylglucosamine:LPS N-acetylglucosamine transferase